MRLLICCLLVGTCLGTDASVEAAVVEDLSLQLVIQAEEPIPAGEPVSVWVLLHNGSDTPRRVAPVYFLSRDYLELKFESDDGRSVEPVYGAVDIASRIDKADFELLAPGGITGAEVLFSPRLEAGDTVHGLTPGCYRVRATLHLQDFAPHFEWGSEPQPDRGSYRSSVQCLCIAAPDKDTLELFRERLTGDDLEKVIEALTYFSNVPDLEASRRIRGIVGEPRGWMQRFPSPFHVLMALTVQPDREVNWAYFEEARGTRHEQLVKEFNDATWSSSTSRH